MSLAGKGVVVTGAGNGVGKAIATHLAAGGARVVVNDLDADAAGAVAEQIGGHAVPGDAASAPGAEALVRRSWELLGDVEVWFGNAGVERGRTLATSEEDWALSHEVNVMAHVRAARLLVPRWLERGSGRYVVTASAAGLLTLLEGPSYSVTKHGAVAFAEWLSATYRHRGIVVQALCPQGVRTQMLPTGGLQDLLSHDSALTPEEVADTVWEALADDRFFILPHPEVGGYYAARATDTDRWLAGMNKLQRKLDDLAVADPTGGQ
ncbi:Short-chain dehydrogenase [Prauserella aidingensis]|uniref:SDR family NAD(P)-dependent oxidoreductase n=1 Tax=Prauserella aidingensis TaxID=387890 RepID=UPI0020A29CBD|nr:SDR family oxidoreductase [Prauserella aidingensis]MCP2255994.1 Short-chain dehydrogenase [Prauserella aidingensis]